MNSLAALYVLRDGPYNLPGIDLWDEKRDARKYRGPYPVVAHPPCERWGRYWGGGPMLHGTPNLRLRMRGLTTDFRAQLATEAGQSLTSSEDAPAV
jgi:hypothetical protein